MEAWQTELMQKRDLLAKELLALLEEQKRQEFASHKLLLQRHVDAIKRLYDAVSERLQVAITEESLQKLGFEKNAAGQWFFVFSGCNSILWKGGTRFEILDVDGNSINAEFKDAVELARFGSVWPRPMERFEIDSEAHKCLLSS